MERIRMGFNGYNKFTSETPRLSPNFSSEPEYKMSDSYSAKYLYDLNIKELPTLIEPIFPKTGLTVFAGSSDTGKSTFLRQLAISIARGDNDFLGWKINAEHNRVIYVSTEDDKYAISYLLNKVVGEDGNTAGFENLKYVFSLEHPYEDLDALLTETPADCVIIDAFSDLYPGDMNQVNKVRGFMNQFFMLTDKHNCLVIFLHHTGKRTEDLPPSKSNLLGSQGIEGKARQVIELRRDPNDAQYRHVCIVKGNYLTDDMKTHSYKLLFENQYFTMTDDRVDFDNLVVNFDEKKQMKERRISRVVELYSPEISYQEIADRMTSEGMKISKSTVGNDVMEAKSRGLIE
ncbi:hypothetical protein AQPE_2002 [Aquipluma nitroreducens]|uniref:AAA family ATPase n=1 Tax=Aquipluma nitroreducens TaxID=2010828 RepID=A0A5K7S8F9_9BACT|nr:AAA family ATPase [Aquipluma nitroreducens]BBE17843.1 hypothetical protein AQPE_2002 [Aquipluma nitroreducens]